MKNNNKIIKPKNQNSILRSIIEEIYYRLDIDSNRDYLNRYAKEKYISDNTTNLEDVNNLHKVIDELKKGKVKTVKTSFNLSPLFCI